MDNHESRHDATARIIREWDAMNAAARVKRQPTRTQKVRAFARRFGWVAVVFPPVMVAVFMWVHLEA